MRSWADGPGAVDSETRVTCHSQRLLSFSRFRHQFPSGAEARLPALLMCPALFADAPRQKGGTVALGRGGDSEPSEEFLRHALSPTPPDLRFLPNKQAGKLSLFELKLHGCHVPSQCFQAATPKPLPVVLGTMRFA